MNFAIVGLGFISGRHIQAMNDVDGHLLIACDIDETKKHKSKNATFYTDWRNIFNDKDFDKIDYVSICTPNHLHFPMAKAFAKAGKKVICEKPIVIRQQDLDELKEYNDKISCVLQLRYNPELIKYREGLKGHCITDFAVCVHRDDWYFNCWKNNYKESGGLAFNIGSHYFDLLCWFFGKAISQKLEVHTDKEIKGYVEFEYCRTKFVLSIDQPIDNQYRYLHINGEELDLTKHFEGLHTKVYKNILSGNSIRITDIEDSINLILNLFQPSV